MELKDLRFYQYLLRQDQKLAVQVASVYHATKETINAIAGCYDNYTMHDIGHSLRVASYMEELSCGLDDFEKNLNRFNAFEVALMLLSALLHDIGMFIRPEDRERIRRDDIPYTNSLTFRGVLDVVNGSEEEAIKEIVRITHAQRIREYVDYDFNGKTISSILQLDDKYGYADDVVDISAAHGENYDHLSRLRTQCTKGSYTYDPQYIAVLLRIADYLDLDKQRTPILWYRMMRIDGFSREEWEKHFIVHNEKKLKRYVEGKYQIYFEGKSSNAKIHRRYLAYVDGLRMELERADELLNRQSAEEKYRFHVSPKVIDGVTTEGFRYSDLRLNLDYSSITELLMGNNIYGDKRLGLRELLQNSLDACALMREIQIKTGEEEYIPQIYILISKEKGYVKIKDGGIGMTIDVVKKHFLNVGKSYYRSNEFTYASYNYKPIGQFGIGFLACFLLSDNVTVKTRFYRSNEIHQIELEKHSEYVVTNTEEEMGSFSGTEITLDYERFFEVFSGVDEVVSFVQRYFLTDIPIIIKDVDKKAEVARGVSDAASVMARIDLESGGGKYEDISCALYSERIDGLIRIRESRQRTEFSVESIGTEKSYLYDKEKGFQPVDAVNTLPDGHYRLLRYVKVEAEDYERIAQSKRAAKSRRNALFALPEREELTLLLPEGVRLTYRTDLIENELPVVVDDRLVRELLPQAELPYYGELAEELEYYIPIFLHQGSYVRLSNEHLLGTERWFASEERESLVFYNKGIMVKNVYALACRLPAELRLRAVINYREQGIKLDVSRNNILSSRKDIQREIEGVMLQYLLKKETQKAEKEKTEKDELGSARREMLEAMLRNVAARSTEK